MVDRLITPAEIRKRGVPADLTGVLWPDGTIECRHRVGHEGGSLIAEGDTVGLVLTDADVTCDRCSDACE